MASIIRLKQEQQQQKLKLTTKTSVIPIGKYFMCYSRRQIKFQIPFCRMAVERLKNGGGGGGETVRRLVKKTAVPFDRRYHFNLSFSMHASLKEI